MPSIYAYRKVIDAITTHTLRLPEPAAGGAAAAQELATLADGRTIVVLFGAATLPAGQPAAIQASIALLPTPLPDALREQVKAASPHVRLISSRMIEQIRALYSIDDEMFFARIGVGAALNLYQPTVQETADMQNFGAFVEGVRQWGRAERAKLGL